MRSAETGSTVATSAGERVLAAILVGIGVAMVAVGLYLKPDPAGCGTHTQLHLPPCAFKAFSGLPCPACGMTTSVAHMARGEVFAAFDAHPFGIVIFAVALFLAMLGAHALVRNRPVSPALRKYFNNKILTALGIALVAAWLFNFFRCL